MPLPLTIAASNFDVVIYILAGVVWVVFQLLSRAAKSKLPGPPTPSESRPARPAPRPAAEDFKEFMEMLSGRRTEELAPQERTEAASVTEELPRPRPARMPPRPSAYALPTAARPVTEQIFQSRTARVPRPPPPRRRPEPGAGRRTLADVAARLVSDQPAAAVPVPIPGLPQPASNLQAQLHITPLMHMRWPGSVFSQSIGATSRPARQSLLRRRLQGPTALRHAMISRLVLGPPGGR